MKGLAGGFGIFELKAQSEGQTVQKSSHFLYRFAQFANEMIIFAARKMKYLNRMWVDIRHWRSTILVFLVDRHFETW